MAQAAVNGALDVRADETKYGGQWQQIIRGLNQTLEGFAKPMHDIAQVLQRMAAKDFSQAVETKYPGAYGELRDNVNSGGGATSARRWSRSAKAPTSSPKGPA